MKNLFLIIGAPGSGKTTDANLIAENDKSFTHYSTGDLLRDEVNSDSELGKKINGFISKGNLVPLKIVIDTIIKALHKAKTSNVVLDGYPRSIEQMMELDKVLSNQNEICLKSVIEVDVTEETARNRVLGRARGADDNNDIFNNRMKVYLEPINEIRNFYNNKNLLYKVNGEGEIQEIVSEIQHLINNIKGK